MKNKVNTYISYSFFSCLSFLVIKFAITIFVEKFWDNIVTTTDITITIEIEWNMGNFSLATLFLQFSIGFYILTVG